MVCTRFETSSLRKENRRRRPTVFAEPENATVRSRMPGKGMKVVEISCSIVRRTEKIGAQFRNTAGGLEEKIDVRKLGGLGRFLKKAQISSYEGARPGSVPSRKSPGILCVFHQRLPSDSTSRAFAETRSSPSRAIAATRRKLRCEACWPNSIQRWRRLSPEGDFLADLENRFRPRREWPSRNGLKEKKNGKRIERKFAANHGMAIMPPTEARWSVRGKFCAISAPVRKIKKNRCHAEGSTPYTPTAGF